MGDAEGNHQESITPTTGGEVMGARIGRTEMEMMCSRCAGSMHWAEKALALVAELTRELERSQSVDRAIISQYIINAEVWKALAEALEKTSQRLDKHRTSPGEISALDEAVEKAEAAVKAQGLR